MSLKFTLVSYAFPRRESYLQKKLTEGYYSVQKPFLSSENLLYLNWPSRHGVRWYKNHAPGPLPPSSSSHTTCVLFSRAPQLKKPETISLRSATTILSSWRHKNFNCRTFLRSYFGAVRFLFVFRLCFCFSGDRKLCIFWR